MTPDPSPPKDEERLVDALDGARRYAEGIVETIRHPLLVLDGDLRVERANPAFYRTFSTTAEATEGKRLYRLGNGQWDIPRLRHALEETLSRDEPVTDHEVVHEFEDVGRRVMLLNARRIYEAGEATERILLAIEDVTERRQAERQLERYARELESSNQELERFAYVASHDLQEPLRMVISYVELLERRYGDRFDQDGREFMEYAVEGARRMKKLIDDLLAYSRVGTRGAEMETLDSGEALDDALSNLERKIEEAEAEITRGDLPSVVADRNQLVRVFQNLLDNAIKYCGEAPPRVHVSAERAEDGRWRFSVTDEGIGIASEHRDRALEIFQQVHPTSREGGGTGIGLAICRKVVERHEGRLWLESETGEGTTVHFTLPGTDAAAALTFGPAEPPEGSRQ